MHSLKEAKEEVKYCELDVFLVFWCDTHSLEVKDLDLKCNLFLRSYSVDLYRDIQFTHWLSSGDVYVCEST